MNRASGSPGPGSTRRSTNGWAKATADAASARWCLTAWNVPIATLNCLRSAAQPTVRSSIRSPSPTSWAAAPRAAVETGHGLGTVEPPTITELSDGSHSTRHSATGPVDRGHRSVASGPGELVDLAPVAHQEDVRRLRRGHGYGEPGKPTSTVADPSGDAGRAAPRCSPGVLPQQAGAATYAVDDTGRGQRPARSSTSSGTRSSSVSPGRRSPPGTMTPARPSRRGRPTPPGRGRLRRRALALPAPVPRGAPRPQAGTCRPGSAHGVAEVDLILGRCEPHGLLPAPRGRPKRALGDDVALDLVGARRRSAPTGRTVALHPGAVELGVRAEQVERRPCSRMSSSDQNTLLKLRAPGNGPRRCR